MLEPMSPFRRNYSNKKTRHNSGAALLVYTEFVDCDYMFNARKRSETRLISRTTSSGP